MWVAVEASRRARGTGDCELLDVFAGNQILVFARAASVLSH